jgi:hypothetical protein
MASYFARHEIDKRGKNYGNEDNPSAGHIAWRCGAATRAAPGARSQKEDRQRS